MPYFVKVGYEKENIYKVTSKGYLIKRIGKIIYTKWGAIDVVGMKIKKFTWHKTSFDDTYEFRSIEEANKFKSKKISELIGKGYDKLPSSSRIY